MRIRALRAAALLVALTPAATLTPAAALTPSAPYAAAVVTPDTQLVVATSASNGSSKSVTATCPKGTQVIGTGGKITDTGYGDASGGDGQVSVTDIVPTADLSAVVVTAGVRDPLNWDGSVDTFTVTAQALCARTLTVPYVTGLERVSATSLESGTNLPLKMVWAYCSPGKHILGTGFQLNRANGKVFVNRVWPTGTMEGVEVHAYADVLNYTGQVAEGDLNAPPPWSGVWDLKAFAICADVNSGTMIGNAGIGNVESATETLTCPLGTVPTTVFVDLLGDYQVDYRLSTMALEALSLDPAKPGPGSVYTTTTRVSIDQASDWVMFVYPHCF